MRKLTGKKTLDTSTILSPTQDLDTTVHLTQSFWMAPPILVVNQI